jgi:hypothetical protein
MVLENIGEVLVADSSETRNSGDVGRNSGSRDKKSGSRTGNKGKWNGINVVGEG